jgi:hypothetical protein
LGTASLGTTGAAQYAATLIAGSYVISWMGDSALCSGTSPPSVACNTAPLQTGVSFRQSGVLDVDVPTTQLQGAVTENGAVLPDAPSGRGTVGFVFGGAHPFYGSSLGTSGPGRHAETLVSGAYVITHQPGMMLCPMTPTSSAPCAEQVLLGCN